MTILHSIQDLQTRIPWLIPKPRHLNWLLAAGCFSMMAVALYMEHFMHLEPCPLCILQRVAVMAVGAIALLAALHNPGQRGVSIYAGLTGLAALTGAGIAGRQLWLQSLPEDQVPSCGPGLDYLMDVFSPFEVLQMVLAGDGSCAEVVWQFLGLSIPGWALVGFLGLLLAAIFQIVRPRLSL